MDLFEYVAFFCEQLLAVLNVESLHEREKQFFATGAIDSKHAIRVVYMRNGKTI